MKINLLQKSCWHARLLYEDTRAERNDKIHFGITETKYPPGMDNDMSIISRLLGYVKYALD